MEITSSNEKGSVIISEDVLASIATNAAKDVDGVSSFSNRPVDVVSTIKSGSFKVMSPVRIHQNGDDITISIYLNLEPNKKIRAVSQNVQSNVKEAVQNMTGKLVSKVNVIVAGIDFEENGANEPLQNKE
ncbi:MAG: Asp23/Gls24 family envelope stress response protein [Eubacterium sp.]|nr:Asp23/Gls24 family envelope stress response protein [Eubacterium sp.]MBR1531959.1 Asp23/Gls24 family envelope stress response protein [Eubacterium sp.]MBR2279062.1 Asp23/Gls24 family envelope stress response protein [Eubacterium sp.]